MTKEESEVKVNENSYLKGSYFIQTRSHRKFKLLEINMQPKGEDWEIICVLKNDEPPVYAKIAEPLKIILEEHFYKKA